MESKFEFLSSSKGYSELQQKLENINELVSNSLIKFTSELESDCPYSIMDIIKGNYEGESFIEIDDSNDTFDIDWWSMHSLLSIYIGKILDRSFASKSKLMEVGNWYVYENMLKNGLSFHSYEHLLPGFTEETKPISIDYNDLVSILELSNYSFLEFLEEMLDQVLLENLKSHYENPKCYDLLDSNYIVETLCRVLSE